MNKENKNSLMIFENKEVRHIRHNGELFFSVVDIVEVLSESPHPRQYWEKVKQREFIEIEVSPIWVQLKLEASDRKFRFTDCVNTENALRLIQSIPSKKAEHFKMWLAKVGHDRIREIENPELAANRAREIYRTKGYPEGWIEKRMRGIEVRETLTGEWKGRGAKERIEYAILTNEILHGTFDMSAEDYKKFKGLRRENLRDHMDDLELILIMLGEATTTRIHKDRDSKGFEKLKGDAKEGGMVAGRTRKDIEKRTGKSISTKANFLSLKQNNIK
jgi:hypothetical protein